MNCSVHVTPLFSTSLSFGVPAFSGSSTLALDFAQVEFCLFSWFPIFLSIPTPANCCFSFAVESIFDLCWSCSFLVSWYPNCCNPKVRSIFAPSDLLLDIGTADTWQVTLNATCEYWNSNDFDFSMIRDQFEHSANAYSSYFLELVLSL